MHNQARIERTPTHRSNRMSAQRSLQAIADGVQRLSPVDRQILQALLRYPFLRAEDIGVARHTNPRSKRYF